MGIAAACWVVQVGLEWIGRGLLAGLSPAGAVPDVDDLPGLLLDRLSPGGA